MQTPEEYRENPIFGTKFDKPPSFILNDVRNGLLKLRGTINDMEHGYPGLKDWVEDYAGFFTVGLSSLHSTVEKLKERETKQNDSKYGKSVCFKSRGIGLDCTNGCFICGGDKDALMNNISGFVFLREDGDLIESWFKTGSRFDYRESEPSWMQVKIGACDKHIDHLEMLNKMILDYDVIRESMIRIVIDKLHKDHPIKEER